MRWFPLAAAIAGVMLAFALRRTRWARTSLWASRAAYGLLVLQVPAYFLGKSGFEASAPACQWTFGPALALYSLTNYPHIVLFTLLFLLSYAQLPGVPRAAAWAALATVAVGLLLELSQGATGEGNCRMRDLIPDSAGALIGYALVTAGRKILGASRRSFLPQHHR